MRLQINSSYSVYLNKTQNVYFCPMWKPIFDYLNRPYPIIENNGSVVIMAGFYGAFVALFLWIFQPFGVPDFSVDSALICLGYGLVTFVIILLSPV